jgi:hypothetical protein
MIPEEDDAILFFFDRPALPECRTFPWGVAVQMIRRWHGEPQLDESRQVIIATLMNTNTALGSTMPWAFLAPDPFLGAQQRLSLWRVTRPGLPQLPLTRFRTPTQIEAHFLR